MSELKLTNVRGAFLALFEAKAFAGGEGGAVYSGSFIIAKTDPQIKAINAAIDAEGKAKWADKAVAILKTIRATDKTFLHDGDLKEQYEGFPGNFFIAARNKSRPLVIDRDKTPLTEKDGKPYSGSFVNIILDIWAQDNQYGKRVNATLKGVQFVKDGDAFSGSAPASADSFDDLSEGTDGLA
jgi:Protein of unknown function (DUF2815)